MAASPWVSPGLLGSPRVSPADPRSRAPRSRAPRSREVVGHGGRAPGGRAPFSSKMTSSLYQSHVNFKTKQSLA